MLRHCSLDEMILNVIRSGAQTNAKEQHHGPFIIKAEIFWKRNRKKANLGMLTEIFVKINCYNHKVCLEIFFFRQIRLNYANNVEFGNIFLLVSFSLSEQLVLFTFSSLHFVSKLFSCIVRNLICQTHFRASYLNNITHTLHWIVEHHNV